LAGLALMVVAVWLKKKGKPIWFVVLPMVFMVAMTSYALFILVCQYKLSVLGIIGGSLLLLAIILIVEAIEIFQAKEYFKQFLHFKGGK